MTEGIGMTLLLLLVMSLLLSKSARMVTTSIQRLAVRLHISHFFVSVLLLSVATSLPELFVGTVSAFEEKSVFALGMLLGSNIADIGLVAGGATILTRSVKISKTILSKDVLYALGMSFIPVFLFLDGSLSRLDGIVLFGLFGLHILKLTREYKLTEHKLFDFIERDGAKALFTFLVGMVILLISAEAVVKLSVLAGTQLKIPLLLIGFFAVAIGTSLPELGVEIAAASKRDGEVFFGDVLGSLVTNSTLILGLVAIISPIVLESIAPYLLAIFFLAILSTFFFLFVRSKQTLSQGEGAVLLLFYVLFAIIEFVRTRI